MAQKGLQLYFAYYHVLKSTVYFAESHDARSCVRNLVMLILQHCPMLN